MLRNQGTKAFRTDFSKDRCSSAPGRNCAGSCAETIGQFSRKCLRAVFFKRKRRGREAFMAPHCHLLTRETPRHRSWKKAPVSRWLASQSNSKDRRFLGTPDLMLGKGRHRPQGPLQNKTSTTSSRPRDHSNSGGSPGSQNPPQRTWGCISTGGLWTRTWAESGGGGSLRARLSW